MEKVSEEVSFERDDEVPLDPGKSASVQRKEVSGDEQIVMLSSDEDLEVGQTLPPGTDLSTSQRDVPQRRLSSKATDDDSATHHATSAKAESTRNLRFHPAVVRSDQEAIPQSHSARTKRHLRNLFTLRKSSSDRDPLRQENDSERSQVLNHISSHGRFFVSTRKPRNAPSRPDGSDTSESSVRPRQYILETIRPNRRSDWKLLKKLGVPDQHLAVQDSTGDQRSSCSCFGIQPNELVVKYLHWTFRSRFAPVIFSMSIIFFTLTILFTFLIYIFAQQRPTCLGGVGPEFGGPEGGTFMDAYSLSWTTFCATGYGIVNPAVSVVEPDRWKCVGLTILVTVEAFSGILFASMCGAILFAKVARIQSFAQVNFSDPIVIRYGSGVVIDKDAVDHEEASFEDTDGSEGIPPPVLEFRINNRLHSITGGELIDATVNIVASIDATQACPTVTTNMRRKGGKKKKLKRLNDSGEKSPLFPSNLKPSWLESNHTDPLSLANKIEPQAITEDPTGHLVPHRIFAKLQVETPDHPFFKRTWTVRHELNLSSPLLKTHARQLMRMNQGFWPKELNTHQQVRDAIHFDQILVSLVGTSNADVSTVSAQHAYDFSDLCAGYQFVNQIFRDTRDGTLRVDTRLINDVKEQMGGGGEELSTLVALGTSKPHDMLVL